MKTMLKVTLVIAMFGSTVFASEGDMGNGKSCPTGQICRPAGEPVNDKFDSLEDLMAMINYYLGTSL